MVSPAIPREQLETASWGQRRLVAAVEFYQRAREGRPSPCRFHPSCSSYAMESLEVHGAARGGWLTLRRLVRCRPFGPSGFDPVPPAPRGRATDIGVSHLVRHLRIAVPVAVQKG